MGDVERATEGRNHNVDVGAAPLVALLCDADVRGDLERTRRPPWYGEAAYTLEDMEQEGRIAKEAFGLALAWGMSLPDIK
ncbi:MAG: hypothetical protein MR698_03320 [Selenomonas sp.]|nr:hypothetical protein [Selenomonas sp.]